MRETFSQENLRGSVMRSRHKWKANIKVDHKELGYEDMD
jgi:hypothetical protein